MTKKIILIIQVIEPLFIHCRTYIYEGAAAEVRENEYFSIFPIFQLNYSIFLDSKSAAAAAAGKSTTPGTTTTETEGKN